MSSFVILANVSLIFYIMYSFHETWRGHYRIETGCVTQYGCAGLLCSVLALLVPADYHTLIYLGMLIIFPVYMYYKEEGYFHQLILWYILLIVTAIILFVIRYMTSVIPGLDAEFYFQIDILYFNILMILSISFLLRTQKLQEAAYVIVVNIGLLMSCLLDLLYINQAGPGTYPFSSMIPIIFSMCFMILFRMFYTMQLGKENVLKLTIQRYADKENNEKYEMMEKENQIIMRQMHDMKKHLQILDNLTENSEQYSTYKEEITKKAEELLSVRQTGNVLIDRILQTYRPRFHEEHIQCNVEVDDIDYSFIAPVDMGALLANLLDNAMESCRKCDDRFLLLKIKQQRQLVVIKMKNSCREVNVFEGELLTTKSDQLYHGYGMRNISMIAKKYGGSLNYEFDEEHHVFVTSISLFTDR